MDTDIQIRRCVPGDEAALALVGQATFLETFAGILGGSDIVAHCGKAHTAGLYRMWLTDLSMACGLPRAATATRPLATWLPHRPSYLYPTRLATWS